MREGGHVIGGAFEGVEREGRGGVSPAVAHHVWGDNTETKRGQEGDLVAPS